MSAEGMRRVRTGVAGLDEILHGGLIAQRLYLVDGNPGCGKTTFALQFLLEGVRRGEVCTSPCRRHAKSWRLVPPHTAGRSMLWRSSS
jgi:RecA/RadA recombinase